MKSSDTRLIRLIALFKLLKAALLIAIGVGALQLLRIDIANVLPQWDAKLGLDPDGRLIGRAILEAASLTPNRIRDLGVGSFIYAALFLTEGIGLWLVKRWAEWFTIIITSSFIPVEVYGIYHHLTALKVLALLISAVVVAYLIYRIRIERSESGPLTTVAPVKNRTVHVPNDAQ
jgi:uncharacterized membrane protein (DUF2068 family)